MDRDRFWGIVEGVRPQVSVDPDGFDEALAATLAGLTVDDVVAFGAAWDVLKLEAFTWELWAAAWVLQGGCDDWGFEGFRDRVIALGREVFEDAVHDPDSLADVDAAWPSADDEDLWISTAAAEAYERLTGEDSEDVEAEPQEPAGERWELGSVVVLVPRLAAKASYDAERVRLEPLDPCPCCGNLTIEEPGEHDICPVCWWEDGGENDASLEQARENYARFGASHERSRDDARPPRPWELPGRAG